MKVVVQDMLMDSRSAPLLLRLPPQIFRLVTKGRMARSAVLFSQET